MKIISVIGYSNSGKTTLIERLVKKLTEEGYSVGTVKNIHCGNFEIHAAGKDTHRHKEAGAKLVSAVTGSETVITFNRRMELRELLPFYKNIDFLLLEGIRDNQIATILTADCIEDLIEQIDDHIFLISGKISEKISCFKDLKSINAIDNIEELYDMVKKNAFDI